MRGTIDARVLEEHLFYKFVALASEWLYSKAGSQTRSNIVEPTHCSLTHISPLRSSMESVRCRNVVTIPNALGDFQVLVWTWQIGY